MTINLVKLVSPVQLTANQLTSYPLLQIARHHGIDLTYMYAFAHATAVRYDIIRGPVPKLIEEASFHVEMALMMTSKPFRDYFKSLVHVAVLQRIYGY